MAPQTLRAGKIILICLILVTTIWGYYETLDDFFIMDDFTMIRGHSSFRQFLDHWSSPVGGNTYRPLIDLLFIWDFSWWKWNPLGWHLSNLLFHLLNVLLVFKLGQELSKSMYAGLLAGLLFGLHPANSEAVIWISARMDVVCTTGVLLSLYYFIVSTTIPGIARAQEKKRRRASILSLVYFACALLIKEMAVTLPVLIILYDLMFSTYWKDLQRDIRKKLRLYLPYMVVFVCYFTLRALVVANTHGYSSKARAFLGGYETTIFGPFIFGNIEWYFKNLMKPFWEDLFSFSLLINFTSIVLVTLCCVLLSKTSRFAVSWIWIALLPVCFLRIHRGVYLASVGFCLLISMFLTRLPGGFSSQSSFLHKRLWRVLFQTVQIILIVMLLFRYGIARKEENAWWSRVAEINENVPLMVKTMYPTFPEGARICLQNLSLVFNQRFNDAFEFRYPDADLGGIHVKDFEECVRNVPADTIERDYFFLYYSDSILYDFTYETREHLTSRHRLDIRKFHRRPEFKLSPAHPSITVELDRNSPCSAMSIVSSLANGIDAPQGAIIAHGSLEGRHGERKTFEIIAGRDTAEWALRFPHIQSLVQHDMPRPYRVWTVRQPEGTFALAQNYIKFVSFETPFAPARLVLEMRTLENMAPDLTLDIDRIILYTTAPL